MPDHISIIPVYIARDKVNRSIERNKPVSMLNEQHWIGYNKKDFDLLTCNREELEEYLQKK